jgi:hypothetical protein
LDILCIYISNGISFPVFPPGTPSPTPSPPTSITMDPFYPSTPILPPGHSPTLGRWAFTGPSAFPPIDARQFHPLLQLWLEPRVPPCVIFGGWFSPWELCGVWLVDIFFPYGVPNSFSSFSPFSNSSIGGPGAQTNGWMQASASRLYSSGSGRASQGIATSGSCQQPLVGNIVWVWCLYVGWISRWGSLWIAFPSVSAPYLVPAFPLEPFWLRIWRWVGSQISQPGVAPNLCIWSLQVLPPLCWAFQLFSSLLGLGSLLFPGTWDWLVATSSSPSPIATRLCSISRSSIYHASCIASVLTVDAPQQLHHVPATMPSLLQQPAPSNWAKISLSTLALVTGVSLIFKILVSIIIHVIFRNSGDWNTDISSKRPVLIHKIFQVTRRKKNPELLFYQLEELSIGEHRDSI